MGTKWNIDSEQSDVLIKNKHAIVGFITGNSNKFKGNVAILNDCIEEVNLEFSLNLYNDSKLELMDTHLKINDFIDTNEYPMINFKSTSFQKVNKNINFLKGNLTIKNIKKVIEFDTEFMGYTFYNGIKKASFEVKGLINRGDFNLQSNAIYQMGGIATGQDLSIEANLEFKV